MFRCRCFFVFCAALLFSGCSPQSLFYYPNRQLYVDPAAAGLKYEIVEYPSLNGKMLVALSFRTDLPPKGTIVHFHGNFGNVSNHFPLALFLVRQGFDVIAFDYEGYGASEGKPTPKNTVNDGIATVRYAQAHLRNPKTGVAVFGQSLGGAIGIVVAAREKAVKGAVIEAAFASYREMGRTALKRSMWTWLFSPLSSVFLSHQYDPITYIGDISPRPVFLIHGTADKIVPVQMSQELYAKARDPKAIWIVNGAGHLDCHAAAGKEYEHRIGEFFERAITGSAGS